MTNWDEIRNAYVTGDFSLAEVARQFGVSLSRVKARSAREGWVAQRRAFREQAVAAGRERAKEEAAEGAALICKIARLLLEKFYAALQADGIELSPHHAAQWANILLALEEMGKAQEARKIIVKWVAEHSEDSGDSDSL